jgi:hypothetical protein
MAMKAQRARWVVGFNVRSRPLYPLQRHPVPIVQEAGWAPRPVWKGAEYLAPPGFDPRTVQPVASRSADWNIPAHKFGTLRNWAYKEFKISSRYTCTRVVKKGRKWKKIILINRKKFAIPRNAAWGLGNGAHWGEDLLTVSRMRI